ncbi:MAG: acyltransferase [Bacteroidaceae bacterium]
MQTIAPQKPRNSNFELLRFASMMLIVMHHFLIATEHVDYANKTLQGGEILNGFAVIGVNCFILISGYYGIKLKVSKVLFIFYSIAFVCLTDYLLHTAFGNVFNLSYALHTILPISSKANWFVPAYLALMCFAPILNRALINLSRKELTNSVLLLTLVTIYAYTTSIASINSNGYSIVQFVYLYILGFWLKDMRELPIWLPIITYLFFALATGLMAITYKTGFTSFAYNAPFVLLSSISFFLIFKNIKIQQEWINRLASSTFIVFLSHYIILYHIKFLSKSTDPYKWFYIAGIYIAIFFCAFILNEIVQRMWHFFSRK